MHEEDLNAQENKGEKKYYRFPKAKSTLGIVIAKMIRENNLKNLNKEA